MPDTHSFKPNDPVVHPKHGLGCVGATEEHEFAGETTRFLTIEFVRAMLTIRIPEKKLAGSGLRPPSSKRTMQSALALLPEPRATPGGHWSKRRLMLEEKLNSGEPKQLAELIRDLSGGQGTAGGRLYREALLRLSEELAVIEGVEVDRAQAMIELRLSGGTTAAAAATG